MSVHDSEAPLDQFSITYLRARWYLGAGLILLAVAVSTSGPSRPYNWVAGVAGLVILIYAFAMRAIGLMEAESALLVDLTVAHLAVFAFSFANGEFAPIVVTAVGASVLIGLFSDGWRRATLLTYTTTMTTITLLATGRWDLPDMIGDVLGALFVIALVSGVIAAVRRRIVELEAVRAQTIGVVSHELRNHLTGVIGATELLQDDSMRLDQATLAELLELAHNQAVEAGDVIEDLLTASRAERGVLDVSVETVDVGLLVETTVRRFCLGDDRVTFDAPKGPVWAVVDPLRYAHVVRNLLSNAVRYGGPEIRVSLQRIRDTASLVVADNGPGVDPADERPSSRLIGDPPTPHQRPARPDWACGSPGIWHAA